MVSTIQYMNYKHHGTIRYIFNSTMTFVNVRSVLLQKFSDALALRILN